MARHAPELVAGMDRNTHPRIIDLLFPHNCIASRARALNVDPTLYLDVVSPDRCRARRNALLEIVGDDPRWSPHPDGSSLTTRFRTSNIARRLMFLPALSAAPPWRTRCFSSRPTHGPDLRRAVTAVRPTQFKRTMNVTRQPRKITACRRCRF
jgi:hypothetical protein